MRAANGHLIIGCALDGTITAFNSGAERILGWRADEVVGQKTMLELPRPGRDTDAGCAAPGRTRGRCAAGDQRARRRSGARLQMPHEGRPAHHRRAVDQCDHGPSGAVYRVRRNRHRRHPGAPGDAVAGRTARDLPAARRPAAVDDGRALGRAVALRDDRRALAGQDRCRSGTVRRPPDRGLLRRTGPCRRAGRLRARPARGCPG